MVDPRVEVGHHMLIQDRDTECFRASGIVIGVRGTTAAVSVFKTWPVHTMERTTMFTLVTRHHPVTKAPLRNSIPLLHANSHILMACSNDELAYRAYTMALEDGVSF